ncbi:MAG: NADH-quinone oxidoreductase subunit N [Nitrospinota bacterium]|nr:NADH-quinone oxidoreductase subunit N [Nitrospinota bacterium]
MDRIPMPEINLGAVAPEMTLAVAAMIILMLEVFSTNKGKDHLAYIALAAVGVAGYLVIGSLGAPLTTFSGMYVVDNFSGFVKLVCLLGAGMTILVSVNYIKDEGIDGGEYYALLLFATIGMFFMVSGADLITIFLGLETMSISLYALAGYTRRRLASNEASMKYFILGALSSAFMLYGMSMIYGATGETGLRDIAQVIGKSKDNIHLVILGGGLLLVGFAFKISAVPFHMWTPDVYQGAPTPVTAFMSSGPKAAAFAAFMRVFSEALISLHYQWWIIVWILALITMTVANLIALNQTNIKRMLAYSSIAHAGYLLVGFTAGGKMGVSAALFYLLIYTFMNIGAFAIVTIVGRAGEECSNVEDFTGLGYRHPLLGLAMVALLFSLAGIPPTAGFWGKYYLFTAALDQGYVWLAVLAALNSVVAVFYYLRVMVVMYMRTEKGESLPKDAFSTPMVVAILVAIYGSVLVGITPGGYLAMAAASGFAP